MQRKIMSTVFLFQLTFKQEKKFVSKQFTSPATPTKRLNDKLFCKTRFETIANHILDISGKQHNDKMICKTVL